MTGAKRAMTGGGAAALSKCGGTTVGSRALAEATMGRTPTTVFSASKVTGSIRGSGDMLDRLREGSGGRPSDGGVSCRGGLIDCSQAMS